MCWRYVEYWIHMALSDSLLCLFSGQVERRGGSYVVEIPESELDPGTVREGQVYRVGLLPAVEASESEASTASTTSEPSAGMSARASQPDRGPPVEEGDVREVEIEDIGEQGDGLARIGPGYVVFVPGTDVGDRVRIEITDARENFAFAEAIGAP